MLPLLTLFNSGLKTYYQSLKKDLSRAGFDPTLLVVSISWASLIMLGGLWLWGDFELPTDPFFYLYWLFVTLIATTAYIFFVSGIYNAKFVAANSFSHLGFIMTAIYAALILHEKLNITQIFAIFVVLLGILLFFEWKPITKIQLLENRGLLLIVFSILINPISLIFYKLAIAHTSSYHQFLTGRFMMDFVYDSLFFFLFVYFIRKQNPLSQASRFFSSTTALLFMFGMALSNTLDSWLIYKLPASTFVLLETISLPLGYLIAKVKYKEEIKPQYVIGGVLIIGAVFLFVLKSF